MASLRGPGAALRVLSVMDRDVSSGWQVDGLALQVESDRLTVFWKDPAVLGLRHNGPVNDHISPDYKVFCSRVTKLQVEYNLN